MGGFDSLVCVISEVIFTIEVGDKANKMKVTVSLEQCGSAQKVERCVA